MGFKLVTESVHVRFLNQPWNLILTIMGDGLSACSNNSLIFNKHPFFSFLTS